MGRTRRIPYRAVGAARALQARTRGIRTLRTLEDVDAVLDEAAVAFLRSNAEALALLSTVRYAGPTIGHRDPHSAGYREAQMELYRSLSGRDGYDAASAEVSELESSASPRNLYPYSTGQPQTVGEQLEAAGAVLQALGDLQGRRIVEYGPGWGLLTIQLALSGFDVSAVDLNPAMLDVIDRQAGRVEVEVSTVAADMLTFAPDRPVDAAVFFESFHHCFEFPTLLDRLRSDVVAPHGRVLLVGEPISHQALPWGLRLDGLSLWSVRREGWMELGFAVPFFFELAARHGWRAERRRGRGRLTDMWVLTRV